MKSGAKRRAAGAAKGGKSPKKTEAAGVVGLPLPHDSAARHVAGTADYVDDLPAPAGTLHAALGLSDIARGRIRHLDLSAVRAAPGVVAVAAWENIPGDGDIGPVLPGDPLLARDEILHCGQPLFAVAATDRKSALRAARLAKLDCVPLPAVLTLDDALAKRRFLVPRRMFHRIVRGDAAAAIAAAPFRLRGEVRCGDQEHFYLEGQAALAVPREGGMKIFSSTQHPSEVQHAAAKVLGLAMGDVAVETRRIGGGFGGKETQAAQTACAAALLARLSGRAVKLRPPRADDFRMTGKRHPFLGRHAVGFNGRGRILGADLALFADCGCSPDLSLAVLDRAMFHADNAYYYPHVRIVGTPLKTDKPSNTAFRGFGGPQGMLLAEKMTEDIARFLGMDPLDVRRANLYRRGRATPYRQRIDDDALPEIVSELERTSDYRARRAAAAAFNARNPFRKRGVALTPVKFGISFTTSFLNQAGALVNVYRDGGISVNHGGVEMGQGLMIKVAQVVADALGASLSRTRVTATATDKVPNTSATAASSGADLNGKAALLAARKIRRRLAAVAAAKGGVSPGAVRFGGDRVRAGGFECGFAELAEAAYLARVSLSATGYYRAPLIHYDRARGRGRPFLYFARGAAATEAEVDALTGEYKILRADILHEAGRSLNPAADIGQVEGGYVQGLGWLTCEETVWGADGQLLTVGPATYKIPGAGDAPADFRVRLRGGANIAEVVGRSKATGEPPLMLALSARAALAMAVAAAAGAEDDGTTAVSLDAPATPERILTEIVRLSGAGSGGSGGSGVPESPAGRRAAA